jgi:hypothetical protein
LSALNVGDTVSLVSDNSVVGIVVSILEPEIYDRGERVIVFWQKIAKKSYEKESSLCKLS